MRITNKMIEKASDAYAEHRHPQRWDGPPWGEAGRINHKAAIKAALKSFLDDYKPYSKDLNKKTNCGWISVKDHLPNDLDKIDLLINSKRRVVDCIFYDDHHNGKVGWFTIQGVQITNNVTHFMHPPKFPSKV